MPGLAELPERIEALAARAAEGERSADLTRAMEDLLCDGYAACLQIDSRIRRLERRRDELMASGLDRHGDGVLRSLEEQHQALERSAVEARRALGALRARFVRLGGAEAARR